MFLDETSLIRENPARLSGGVAVTDVDGDGAFEFLVAGQGGAPHRALKWCCNQLVDSADAVLADASRPARGFAVADLDGDGREEIYQVGADGPGSDRLLAGFGDRWLDLLGQSKNRSVAERAGGCVAAVLDRQGHGRYGVVVAGDGVPLQLYELDRSGRLVDAAEEAGLDIVTAARALVVAPLLSGLPDLYIAGDGLPNLLFRNIGDGLFEDASERMEVGCNHQHGHPHGRSVVVLDGDGDGGLDLLVGDRRGMHRLFLNRAHGFFENTPPEWSRPSRLGTVVAADFDNDGNEELFVANLGERNRLYGWRGGRWTEMDIGDAAEPRGLSVAAAVADIDGDGRLELLVSHGETVAQPLSFFHAPNNDNHWLRVLPMTPYGAPARGAVVSVTAGGRTQRRVICCGQGAACQMEPIAHFGLGALAAVERVEVIWPDGMDVVVTAPPVGRLLPVPYPPA